MDCQMPVLDGYEATKRLREDPEIHPQPYIVALTASALTGDRELCMAAGMDDYITKPVKTKDLNAALERFRDQRYLSVLN